MMNFLAPYKLWAYAGLVILIALMLGLHLYADNRLRKQRDSAISELNAFKTEIARQTQAREAENLIKRLAGNAKAQAIQAEHEAELKQRDLDRAKSTKAIKDFYENRLDTTHFNYAERLRLEAERGRLGLPNESEAVQEPAEGRRERDAAAFDNLEKACIITTLDFNACRDALDNDTATVGRDE
jgi:uncharacterized protein HemX